MVSVLAGLVLCIAFGLLSFFCTDRTARIAFGALGALFLVIGLILYPIANVWQKELSGQASLEEARWSRQIRIQEAEAEKEAATLDAESEVIRARGVKDANDIIADGLGGPEGYLRYLYIQAISKASDKGSSQFVYLPTEAGLPILEAGRGALKDPTSTDNTKQQ